MLLTLALTLTAPVAPPVAHVMAPLERIDDDAALPSIAYEGLVERYETAYDAWRAELKEAEGLKERRALREREPAKLFRPHFEALADSGSGRALVWIIEHARKLEKRKDLGDVILLDQERCILCSRCVRFMEEVPKSPQLCIGGRGSHSVVETWQDTPLSGNYQGNLADVCPVGALTLKDFRFQARVWNLSLIHI